VRSDQRREASLLPKQILIMSGLTILAVIRWLLL
jgi:hypothetical protein